MASEGNQGDTRSMFGRDQRTPVDEGPFGTARRINDFGDRIGELSPRYFDIADRLYAIGTGEDPLFTEMQGGLFDLLRAEEADQVRGLEETFARRGALNTGASQDALTRLHSDFGGRRMMLGNDLTMQRLSMLINSLDPYGAGIETESLPLQLRIALENAQRAGASGGGNDKFLGLI